MKALTVSLAGARPFLDHLAGMTSAQLRGSLARSAVLGIATLGKPVKVTELFAGMIDSDRLDHGKWAWPLNATEIILPPIDWRGAQGFWELPDAVLANAPGKRAKTS